MIYIFTIATNIYTKYFDIFKSTINNFYPEKDKKVIVFSDGLKEYNSFQYDKTIFEIVNIPNLVLSSIYYNKLIFVEWYCLNKNLQDDSIIYFFDIDTYFYNSKKAQNYLLDCLEQHKDSLIFSHHPITIINLYKTDNIKIFGHGYLVKPGDNGVTTNALDDYSFSKYNLIDKDLIASFFAGTIKSLKNVNLVFRHIHKNILLNDRVISTYPEEDILNFILLKQLIGEINEQYIYVPDKPLITINTENPKDPTKFIHYVANIDIKQEDYDFFLISQKYNQSLKGERY